MSAPMQAVVLSGPAADEPATFERWGAKPACHWLPTCDAAAAAARAQIRLRAVDSARLARSVK